MASFKGNARIAECLLRAGANPEIENKFHNKPLIFAAYYGKEETSRTLLAAGADVTAYCRKNGLTALHKACMQGHVGTARILLEAGAFPFSLDKKERTPADVIGVDGERKVEESTRKELENLLQTGGRRVFSSSHPEHELAFTVVTMSNTLCARCACRLREESPVFRCPSCEPDFYLCLKCLKSENRENTRITDLGDLSPGVLGNCDNNGTFYIMYSATLLADRNIIFPSTSAEQFCLVQYDEDKGAWTYDSNVKMVEFNIETDDVLVAEVEISAGVITSIVALDNLDGQTLQSMTYGYFEGDLSFVGNHYNGSYNEGQMEISGTYFCTAGWDYNIPDIEVEKQPALAEENPATLEEVKVNAFDVEAFISKLQRDGIAFTKHDRRGHSRERLFFTPDGERLSWRSPGRPIVENKSKIFQIKDLIQIKDGSNEILGFVSKKSLDRDLSFQLVFKSRNIDLTADSLDKKREMITGLETWKQQLS